MEQMVICLTAAVIFTQCVVIAKSCSFEFTDSSGDKIDCVEKGKALPMN